MFFLTICLFGFCYLAVFPLIVIVSCIMLFFIQILFQGTVKRISLRKVESSSTKHIE